MDLVRRAGVVTVALGLCALGAWAQESKPAEPPKQDKKQEPSLPPTNDVEEIRRRLKEQAEKMGLKPEVTKPAEQKAPEAKQPEVKQPEVKQPAPAAAPKIQPPAHSPNTAPPKPPATINIPGAAPGTPPATLQGMPAGAPGAGGVSVTTLPADAGGLQGDTWFLNITEPMDLTLLVTKIRDDLGLQIIFQDGGLAGQKVYLSGPVSVRKDQLLYFLTTLLEQKDYTLFRDATGIYMVVPKNAVQGSPPSTNAFSTTRIIRTPNIKPSSIQTAVAGIITASRGNQAGASQPIYMDDLGLIMLTESPRVTQMVEEFIKTLVEERASLKFFRFELQNISAAAAKERVLELLGQQQQRAISAQPGQPGAVQAAPGGLPSPSITNLGERLTVDPTSNSLFLRGRQDERDLLSSMLPLIDLPNGMMSRWYPVGIRTAEAVAYAGSNEQLGATTTYQSSDSGTSGGGVGGLGNRAAPQPGALGQQQATASAGAGFVLYPDAGGFIYRGTEAQHRRVTALIETFGVISAADVTVYEFYKLKHGKAVDVAEVIQNLLTNSAPTGNRGGLLGNDLGSRNRNRNNNNNRNPRAAAGEQANAAAASAGASAGTSIADLEGADVFVLADEPNNQVIVKAPQKLQRQFRDLIMRIDLRRPQVYIDAKIVAVNEGDDFRLAVEAQQIIGQFAFNTNFGLSSLTTTTGSGDSATTTGGLQSRKNVLTNLPGFTSALIRSKDVPFVVTALARDTNGRVIASPQLLVDDNTEAEVSSIEQQATATTSQSGQAGSTVTGFGGYEDAGPKLTVKPQISDGGYLRLEYSLELSSFTGSGSGNLPPPKQENKISSESVTVPTDTTIVVGGLTLENVGKTVVKVPLLGDIPIFGTLFRDESETKRRTTLFAFITPKIMRDPSFSDLRLLTKAPLVDVRLPGEFPEPQPERIDVLDTAKFDTQNRLNEEAKKNDRPEPISPEKGVPVRRDPPMKTDEPN